MDDDEVKQNGSSKPEIKDNKLKKPRPKTKMTTFKPEIQVSDVKRPSFQMTNDDESVRFQRSRKASFFIGENDQIPVTIIGPNNEEICPDDIVVAPDGGWGWVVVFAAFMSNLIVDGTIFSFGIVLVSIVDSAEKTGNPISISTVAWVGGSLTGFYLLAGPFVSSLSNKFGFRVTAIIGSIVGSSGLVLAWYFCRDGTINMPALFIFYGIVGGIGFGLIYVPAVITVGFYFEKKRALATGIAICGSGIGTFLYAPLVKKLVSMFEWQGAVLVQAAIISCCAIFAALYRPLEPKSIEKRKRDRRLNHGIPSPDVTPLLLRIKRARDLEKWDSVNSFVSNEGYYDKNNSSSRVGIDGDLITDPQKSRANKLYENARKSSTHSLSAGIPQHFKQKRLSVPNMLGAVVAFQQSSDVTTSQQQQQQNQRTNSIKNKSFVGLPSNLMEIEEEGETIGDLTEEKSSENKQVTKNELNTGASTRNLRLQSSINLEGENFQNRKNTIPIITLVLSNNSLDISQSRVFKVTSKSSLNKPMYREDIFYSRSIRKIPEYTNSTGNVNSMFPSVEWQAEPISTSLDDLPVNNTKTQKTKCMCDLSVLKMMLDVSLLKSLTFLLLAISGGITMLGFFVPFMYLKAIATEQSLEDDQGTLLIAIIGVANTVGRIICGGVADKLSTNVLLINNTALTIGGLATVIVPFLNSYPLFIMYSCLFGLSIACFASLRSILIVELLGLNKLTNAFGLLLLFQGIAAFVGSPLAGFLRDATGNYAASFYVAGSLILFSGVMCYPIHIINTWEMKRKQEKENSNI